IGYSALSFVAPQKVRFRYKLDGRDQEWQDAGTRRDRRRDARVALGAVPASPAPDRPPVRGATSGARQRAHPDRPTEAKRSLDTAIDRAAERLRKAGTPCKTCAPRLR